MKINEPLGNLNIADVYNHQFRTENCYKNQKVFKNEILNYGIGLI